MRTEHYVVGDHVQVSRRSFSGPITTDEFEIMGRYPVENHETMYRLLSLHDRAERVVPQSELRRCPPIRARH